MTAPAGIPDEWKAIEPVGLCVMDPFYAIMRFKDPCPCRCGRWFDGDAKKQQHLPYCAAKEKAR